MIFKFIFAVFIFMGCSQPPPPLPPPPPPNNQTITQTTVLSGIMNLQDKNTYKQLLEQSGLCGVTSWTTGAYFGTASCSNLEVNPRVQIVFNGNKTAVEELRIFPERERNFWSSGGGVASVFPVTLKSVDGRLYSINDSEGWEVRFYSSQLELPTGDFNSRFEVRLRCEYCDIDDIEYENVDVYKGIYSDGNRFGSISQFTPEEDSF